MRLIRKTLQEEIDQDFLKVESTLKYEQLNDDLKSNCKEIHKKIIAIKIFLNRFGDHLKPVTLRYLNEVVSDLIESYVLLFQDRYKTSKILLRSSVDCMVRGLYVEKVSVEFEDGFTDTLRKLNATLKGIYEARTIASGFLDRAYTNIKTIFDDTSAYVHGGSDIEVSQYADINTIINPVENIDIKKSFSDLMEKYIGDMLYYLILANYNHFYEKCPNNEQNLILQVLTREQYGVVTGRMKVTYFG
ncbi:hypothetical protein [Bacillus cereus]|uniref:hypothetical protein n=1 Tax=Bacillus cereus TaxID=1396 RepID=UPI0009780DEA|nr:hypothetical protein [Bacillus cereus]ONH02517.1 hypothetical protein BKK45_02925 [Bacillus cereus]PFU91680.1 hypothetical protein COK92_18585 [Bacillus anthracis]